MLDIGAILVQHFIKSYQFYKMISKQAPTKSNDITHFKWFETI